MSAALVIALKRGDEAVGGLLDGAFPATANPWRHLGGLAFLFLVVCIATGVYAYVFFDTSVEGAYRSVKALGEDSLGFGAAVRSMHRYSADAFMLVTVLHLLREMVRGHFRGFRAWSWISGFPPLVLAWIGGLTGFWLVWDERALFSLMATAEWFAALPAIADAFARNFLTLDQLNDRFFSLAVFIHIAVPLFALAAFWAHLARLGGARAWPPRPLLLGALAMLALLALARPVASLAMADPARLPVLMPVDWFFLFPHPLGAAIGGAALWAGAIALLAGLVALPWLAARERPTAAVVQLDACNGCARCVADCPFGAVVMVPRTDGRDHAFEAQVIASQCAACGICAGACPSSTPFRRDAAVLTGIDLPQHPVTALREELERVLAPAAGRPAVVVFACPGAAAAPTPAGTAVIAVECAAMVPPSFVEYALRGGAPGVVIAGCREGDCEYRFGDLLTQQRWQAAREPALRPTVPRENVAMAWCGKDRGAFLAALSHLEAPVAGARRPALPARLKRISRETPHA